MPEKTHWKKVVSDPNYLGEADFQDGEEKIATIAKVVNAESIATAEGTSQKAVVHFAEDLKPMILNVARSKAISKVANSPYFEDWIGVRLQLYIKHDIKAFGETVSAVRVRSYKPIERKPVKCADCGAEIQGANGRSAEYIGAYTKKRFGKCLCFDCASKQTEQEATQNAEADE